jgi:hypothetical protein
MIAIVGIDIMKKHTCGNCGKQYSNHYHEDEIYCFEHTNGDVFSSEPSQGEICTYMATYYSDLYEKIIENWKIENGHLDKHFDEKA